MSPHRSPGPAGGSHSHYAVSCQVRPAARARCARSTTFGLGGVGLVTLILAAFVTGGVLSYGAQQAAIAQSLRDVNFGLLALSGIPTAVCLGAYGALVGRYRCLPRWTAWLAGLGAVTHVLIAASFMSHGALLSLECSVIFLAPGTLFAWILATSVVVLQARPRKRTE